MGPGRKFLSVTAGVVGILGCAGIMVNGAETFKEGILENIINSKEFYHSVYVILPFIMLFMIMVRLVAHKVFINGQGEGEGEGHGVLAECTCADPQQVGCVRLDQIHLWELSKRLPSADHLYGIGIHLGIETCVIEACRENKRYNITVAVFDMLCKWYRTQDGLGQNSNGLKELKRALCKNNVSNLQAVLARCTCADTQVPHKVFTYGQGEGQVQCHGIIAECTCTDPEQVGCVRHDQIRLWELSRCLPNEGHMYEIGIHLGIHTRVIEACRENNREKITVAVFDMLWKWYQTQDGLGQNSNGLKELERALCENNVGELQTVLTV